MNEIIKWLAGILPIPAIVVLLVIVTSAWLIKTYYGWDNYRGVLRHGVFIGILCVGIVVLSVYYRELLLHNIALIIIPTSLIAILFLYYFKAIYRSNRGGLAFENITLINDSRYWTEDHAKQRRYPFAIPASQYFYLNEVVSGADPTFTVTVRNNSARNVLLKRIGIEIVCTEHDNVPQGRAGEVPKAIEIPIEHEYIVAMPYLHSDDPDQDPFFPDNPPMNINRLVEIGSRPMVLQPDSFYPYNLTLAGYDVCIPSKALIRMWLQTDLGEERSSPIYLTWGIF